MRPALYVQGRVVMGSHHGEAYAHLTDSEKDSEVFSGFFDPQINKFISDDFQFYLKKILLIRHGEVTNGHVNEAGQTHCAACADGLKNFNFSGYKCFCSPHKRCVETALIFCERCALPYTVEPNVVEHLDYETDEDFRKRVAFVLDWLPEKSVIISHCDFIQTVLKLATDTENPGDIPNCSTSYIENHCALWVGRNYQLQG